MLDVIWWADRYAAGEAIHLRDMLPRHCCGERGAEAISERGSPLQSFDRTTRTIHTDENRSCFGGRHSVSPFSWFWDSHGKKGGSYDHDDGEGQHGSSHAALARPNSGRRFDIEPFGLDLVERSSHIE